MRVLSFDVGIRHMAGCVLDSSSSDDSCCIKWWDIVNLISEETISCDMCKLPGIWQTGDCTIHLCGRHKKQYVPPKHAVETLSAENNGAICSFVGKKACTLKANRSVDQQHVCSKHAPSVAKKAAKLSELKKVKPTKCADINLDEIKLSIWRRFDDMPFLLDVDEVVIENQPCLKAPKMKAIAETVYQYFLCRGIVDCHRTRSSIKKVSYMSATNKLKLDQQFGHQADESVVADPPTKSDSRKYKETKTAGIELCQKILHDCPQLLQVLAIHKKKDDMADSMLQGLYHMTKTSKVNKLKMVDNAIEN